MEGNFSECATGILIDFEGEGNAAVDTESHCNLDETTKDSKDVLTLDNNEASSCITDKFCRINLGDGLDAKREMLSIPKGGWKTPSPKSMNKIWTEACKVIDQLHSSPIESTEALLVDEDFPASEGCFSGSSPESDKDSVKNEESPNYNASIPSPLKEDLEEPLLESEKVSKRIENSTKDGCSQFSTNRGCLDDSSQESGEVFEGNEDCPRTNIPMFDKSCIDAQTSPTEVFNPDISELADVKLENPVPENITQSEKLSKCVEPVSGSIKFIPRNVYKTPVKNSIIINKENGSGKKIQISSSLKPPQSDKKIFKRDVLGDTNKKGIGIIKPASNVESSLKKNLTNVITEKTNISKGVISTNPVIANNRRNSIVPCTPRSLQYQSSLRQKPALCKTMSVVETPNVPKLIRRANSFQTKIGSNSTIKKSETSFEQKSSISAKDSMKKVSNLKRSSEPPNKKFEKTRMSISHIPSNVNTPLKRSGSFTKKSGIASSQIPGPSISLTSHKMSSVAEGSRERPKRPVVSTSSRVRFASRLHLPSTLPMEMNDNLPRNLFPDLKTPRKK